MRPVSLFESSESNGSVSIEALFHIARGGWPASIGNDETTALLRAIDYVEAVINADVSRVDGITKSSSRVRVLMRSLSRNISTLAFNETIRTDIAMSDEDENVSDKTILQYLRALNRIFVTDNLPAWNPALRSKTAVRTSPKRQFADPSIAVATMRLSPERILGDFEYFGFLFESLCDRDLRVYAEANDGQLFHYRDASSLEADAVICLNDGRWAPIEIKLGKKEIEEGAQHLIELKNRIDTAIMKEPSSLMIATGTEVANRREDGVFVVPIGCLRD